eukprot:6492133-Amphidinium_carterae.1
MAQQKVAEHIADSVHSMGPPPSTLTSAEACRRLRLQSVYCEDGMGSCSSVRYDPALVAWPSVGAEPLSLRMLLGTEAVAVDKFVSSQVLAGEEACHMLEERTTPVAYWDPGLHARPSYESFIGELTKRGLVTFMRNQAVKER